MNENSKLDKSKPLLSASDDPIRLTCADLESALNSFESFSSAAAATNIEPKELQSKIQDETFLRLRRQLEELS